MPTGTIMATSSTPPSNWAYAFYLRAKSPNGSPSMTLHRDLGIRQSAVSHPQRLVPERFNRHTGDAWTHGERKSHEEARQ